MNYRAYVIFSGETFLVPEHIQRIEIHPTETGGATYGWQVRYGNDEPIFGDHSADGSGAEASLLAATEELLRRIHTHEAPSGLRKTISASKNSDLPPGISGPIVRPPEKRRVVQYYFGISIPRFGQRPTNTTVYIGTENTAEQRYDKALAKAIQVRNRAEVAFQIAATEAKRSAAPLPSMKYPKTPQK